MTYEISTTRCPNVVSLRTSCLQYCRSLLPRLKCMLLSSDCSLDMLVMYLLLRNCALRLGERGSMLRVKATFIARNDTDTSGVEAEHTNTVQDFSTLSQLAAPIQQRSDTGMCRVRRGLQVFRSDWARPTGQRSMTHRRLDIERARKRVELAGRGDRSTSTN